MKYTGFLCGAFSSKRNFVAKGEWKEITTSDDDCKLFSNFYYPEFVDFNFGQNEQSIRRFSHGINKTIPVNVKDNSVNAEFKDITIYYTPFNLCLFSIRIDMDDEVKNITDTISTLRDILNIKKNNPQYAEMVLNHIVEVYKEISDKTIPQSAEEFDYCQLVEFGNKFKVFQIAEAETDIWNSECNINRLLFTFGTVGLLSASKSYFDEIIEKNKIAVYSNWCALSLFDSFTMLGHSISKQKQDWIDDYFGMIYISELFVKFFLSRTNDDLRIKHKKVRKLLDDFNKFEYNCWFDNVSYNFLPRIIHQSIKKGLDISEEKRCLYRMIEKQKDERERKSDRKINSLLLTLTIITIFSTIADLSGLINEIIPYDTYFCSRSLGFGIVSVGIFLAVLIILLPIFFRRGKR